MKQEIKHTYKYDYILNTRSDVCGIYARTNCLAQQDTNLSELPDESWQIQPHLVICNLTYLSLTFYDYNKRIHLVIHRTPRSIGAPDEKSSQYKPRTPELLKDTNSRVKTFPRIFLPLWQVRTFVMTKADHYSSHFQVHDNFFMSFIFSFLSMYLARLCWTGHFKAGAKLRTLLFLYYVKL